MTHIQSYVIKLLNGHAYFKIPTIRQVWQIFSKVIMLCLLI